MRCLSETASNPPNLVHLFVHSFTEHENVAGLLCSFRRTAALRSGSLPGVRGLTTGEQNQNTSRCRQFLSTPSMPTRPGCHHLSSGAWQQPFTSLPSLAPLTACLNKEIRAFFLKCNLSYALALLKIYSDSPFHRNPYCDL